MGTVFLPSNAVPAVGGVNTDFLSIVAAVTLIILLFAKEFVGAWASGRRRDARFDFLSKALNGPILALLAVFATIVVVRVWDVL